MAGKLTEKVNNDNKSAFEQAIISKDHGSTKEININAQEKQSILKKQQLKILKLDLKIKIP